MRYLALFCVALMVSACATNLPQLPPPTQTPVPDGNLANADAVTLVRLGDRLAAAGDARGAAGIYERAARQDPGNPDILIKLGDVSWRAGGLQQAVVYYDRALAIAPDHRDALSRRARSYLIQNQPEQALMLLDRALAGGEGTSAIWASRGLALDLLGRPVDAQVDYGKAMDLDANNAALRINMALSFALAAEYASSLNLLRDLVNAGNVQAQARDALAMVYALSGQVEVATALKAASSEEAQADDVFYRLLPSLQLRDKAVAVYLRRLPPGALARAQQDEQASAPATPEQAAAPPPGLLSNAEAMMGGEPEPEPMPYESTAHAETAPPAEAVAEPPAATEASAAPARRYWVQLASFRSMAQVAQNWAAVTAKHQSLSVDMRPQVQTIQNAENVTFYRLMAGDFDDKAEARAHCAALSTAGIDCLVTRNDLPAQPLDAALAAAP